MFLWSKNFKPLKNHMNFQFEPQKEATDQNWRQIQLVKPARVTTNICSALTRMSLELDCTKNTCFLSLLSGHFTNAVVLSCM